MLLKKIFDYKIHRIIAFYISSIISIIIFINSNYFDYTINYIEKKYKYIKNYFEEKKNPDFFNSPIDPDDVELFEN